jgi:hypothetical protein
MKSARLIGTIVSLIRLFGAVEESGTFSMVPKIAAATLCGTDKCPTCECPKSELDNTKTRFPLRKTSEIKKEVEAGRA